MNGVFKNSIIIINYGCRQCRVNNIFNRVNRAINYFVR